jgi:predicted XRE-type DNA-binding protein
MKTTAPRWNDESHTPSSGNVSVEPGFPPAESEVMRLRAEMMIRIQQHIKAQGWTQAEAARQLGVTQPRISRLFKHKVEDFSLDMLLTLAIRAGLHPELRLSGGS